MRSTLCRCVVWSYAGCVICGGLGQSLLRLVFPFTHTSGLLMIVYLLSSLLGNSSKRFGAVFARQVPLGLQDFPSHASHLACSKRQMHGL